MMRCKLYGGGMESSSMKADYVHGRKLQNKMVPTRVYPTEYAMMRAALLVLAVVGVEGTRKWQNSKHSRALIEY